MAFWSSRPQCPVDEATRAWVNARMAWLAGQFGMERWRTGQAIEPTDTCFPDPFDSSQAAAQRIFQRVCNYMGVAAAQVKLEFFTDERNSAPARKLDLRSDEGGAAGRYLGEGQPTIEVETSHLRDPLTLIATLAHELAHVRLLGEKRLSAGEDDHEQVTDLATVFFGLGIFTANGCFQFGQGSGGNRYGWSARRLGYLDERILAYALALWSKERGEERPRWARHLAINPRAYMKQTVEFLRTNPQTLAVTGAPFPQPAPKKDTYVYEPKDMIP